MGQTCFVNGLIDEKIKTQLQIFMDGGPSMKEVIDKALVCETHFKSNIHFTKPFKPQIRVKR
jgi:hypothetical protein